MPDGWKTINDEFYSRYADKFVVAKWNGISPDGSGRQSCGFLTDRTRAFGPAFALSSIWPDEAVTFDDRKSAEEFLLRQGDLHPNGPLKNWFVTSLGELDKITGYRPNAKAAIIGDDSEPEETAKPKM